MMNGMTGYRYCENDDMAPIMDTILKRLATKRIEGPASDEWISGAGHCDIEDALEAMMPKEREIIRKYFVEDIQTQVFTISPLHVASQGLQLLFRPSNSHQAVSAFHRI